MTPLSASAGRQSVALMTRAFAEDPYFRYLCPQPAARHAMTEAVMAANFALAERRGRAYGVADDEVRGVCLWYRPGEYPTPTLPTIRARAVAIAGVFRRGHGSLSTIARAWRIGKLLDEAHPRGEPYFYLQVLAVAPELQGRGIGSAMLTECTAEADRSRRPAILETSKPANVRLYERFGFRIVQAVRQPGGPPVWTMRRDPSRDS